MRAFLKLIRFPSLVIIALTMCFLRYFVIKPRLNVDGFDLQFSTVYFACLVLSVVFMAAAAYSINNYFDVKTDMMNNKANVVGKHISRRLSMLIHTIFNTLSLILAFYISYNIGYWQLGFIFVMASGLLWFHSTTYKFSFLVGSILISSVISAIPLLVAMFEIPPLNNVYYTTMLSRQDDFLVLFKWMMAFSVFSFIGMLIGLFIRDLKSLHGDREAKRNSLPLVLGIKYTKLVIASLALILVAMSTSVWYIYLKDLFFRITPYYLFLLIVLPLFIIVLRIFKYKEGDKLMVASICFRIVMFAGVLYTLVINYNMNNFY